MDPLLRMMNPDPKHAPAVKHMSKRMAVGERKTQLLEHGIKLAEKHGYGHVSRKQIGDAAGVSEGLLSLHFGTMTAFRKALMLHAVTTKNMRVIAQGLIAKHPVAVRAPRELKQLALNSIRA